MKKILSFFILSYCVGTTITGQNRDSTISKLTRYASIINHFSMQLPQEKVYLHFDNSAYYQGDDIWFKSYVVTSGQHRASTLSKTLYVELLNPGGEVIDKQILKIENGQCHGSFSLNKLPFYSGFYEIRAYTKYMLNFGEDILFSRTFPVYDKPKKQGAYEEKSLLEYGRGYYPKLRQTPEKQKRINLKFFPEGGNLVKGCPSQVAFEATNAYGIPINISGEVVSGDQGAIIRFNTVHDGKGVFSYTPGDKIQKVVIDYNGKKYPFNLPPALPDGIVLRVDNLSSPDSIGITLQVGNGTPGGLFGLVLMSGSTLQKYLMIDTLEGKPINFKIDKKNLPAGVSRIILFDAAGHILGDRLVFITRNEFLTIGEKTDKETYNPYEPVNMQFTLADQDKNPVKTTFSVSVKDGQNDVKPDQDIQSNLLLTSEIKCYVHNPGYYFETTDSVHQRALDLLLMVQGWHRYSWAWVDGTKPFELKYKPERALEINGQVVTFVKSVPKPHVNVSTLICQKDENGKLNSFMENFVTESLGRFSFNADVEGKWDMVFAVTENGKKKDYRTVLDKLFSPAPKRYRYTDLFGNIAGPEEEKPNLKDTLCAVKDTAAVPKVNYDPIAKKGTEGKVVHLKEVVVKARKWSKEKDIYENRAKSIAYYDVYAEQDKIRDKGGVAQQYLNDFLMATNKDFYLSNGVDSLGNTLMYKTKEVLFVVDYQRTEVAENHKIPNYVRADYIKSIYVSEDLSAILHYADLELSEFKKLRKYSCVVFIEIFPDWKIPTEAGKGVRKTWLDGYSKVKEFYSPNYTALPPEPDYRRTLYWNPSVVTDKDGKAIIQFYSNSSCRNFKISAETITPQGVIGVLKK
ncbi:MAG: hypothetical protein Q8928_01110 [Bacteroidota bacterium]|nr:hypothetical protein [Bacteroidota bacterium]